MYNMATTGFPATGTISAALTLVQWIHHHGREPRPLECCVSNGLMSHRTYYLRIPGSNFSAIISTARELVSHILTFPSNGVCQYGLVSSVKMRLCLGHNCNTQFPYEGAHIGFCPKCRRKRSAIQNEYYEDGAIPGISLRRLGLDWDDI
jgi:hypothetical protein